MILRTSLLALVISIAGTTAFAQKTTAVVQKGTSKSSDSGPAPEIYLNPTAAPQQIFYKWYVRGRAHYGKYIPRGVSNYIKINGQGMVVSERPTNDSFPVLKPLRPVTPEKAAAPAKDQPLPEGSITRQKRCEIAQTNMKTLTEQSQIFEDDNKGNLIPLSADEISKRRQQTQNDLEHFCSPQPATPSLPSIGGNSAPPPAPSVTTPSN